MVHSEKGRSSISGFEPEILQDIGGLIESTFRMLVREGKRTADEARIMLSTCVAEGMRAGEQRAFTEALTEYKNELEQEPKNEKNN